MTAAAVFSFVLEHPPAAPDAAARHFLAKLSVETDPSDLATDLERHPGMLLVIDARSARHFGECHVRGAVSLPYRQITAETTAAFDRDRPIVVYCWGPGCNAATKAASRLAALGFQVKELIGGLGYWRREGHPVEGTLGDRAPLVG